MRTSVLDTLLDTLRRNVARGARDAAVYELGLVTAGPEQPRTAPVPGIESRPEEATLRAILGAVPEQPRHVAIAAAGDADRGGPWGPARPVDASDAVAWSLAVAHAAGLDVAVTAAERAPLAPGALRQAGAGGRDGPRLRRRAAPQGRRGPRPPRAHRRRRARRGRPSWRPRARPCRRVRLSTFPPAHTDVALVVDESVPAAAVESALREGAGASLESVVLFDIYRGDQVGEGSKSLAFRLTFRSAERTLTTEEVSALRDRAVEASARATGAVQR